MTCRTRNSSHLQVTSIYQDEQITVYQPKNTEEAIYLGQDTLWCINALNQNMFEYYSEAGPMQIIIPRIPQYPGEKYQIHLNTVLFINEKDVAVGFVELFKKFPQLKYLYGKRVVSNKNIYWNIETTYISDYGKHNKVTSTLFIIDNNDKIYKNIMDVPIDYVLSKSESVYRDDKFTLDYDQDDLIYIYIINVKFMSLMVKTLLFSICMICLRIHQTMK